MPTIDDVSEEVLAIIKDIRENETNFFQECNAIDSTLLPRVSKGICSYLTENNLNISQEGGGWKSIDEFLEKMAYQISDNKQIYFFRLSYAQENSSLGKVRLQLIEQGSKKHKQKISRSLTAEKAYSVIDLETQNKKVEIEQWLSQGPHLASIKKHFQQSGMLCLPEDIIQELTNIVEKKYSNKISALRSSDDTAMDDEASAVKNILANPKYQFFLDKICELKIKEIAFYLSADDYAGPSAKVRLSVLIVGDQNNANVMTANIKFGKKSRLAYRLSVQETTGTLIQCLIAARWEMPTNEDTLLRFSNVVVEQFVEVRMMFGHIKYGIASDQLKLKKQKVKNFWEDLVYQKVRKSLDEQVESFSSDFDRNYIQSNEVKHIEVKDILEYAKHDLTKNINQSYNVQKILHNQQADHGTLLYLPTAYGKTYVILLAIYQYWVNNGKRADTAPFLVVGPLSVASVWRKSAIDLEQISDGKISYRLENFDQKEIAEDISTSGPKLEFITTEMLNNQLKSWTFIFGKDIRDGKFATIFGLGPAYYLMLGLIKSLNLLVSTDGKRISPVVPIQEKNSNKKAQNNMYVLYGDENVWRQILGDISNKKDEVLNKLKKLQGKHHIFSDEPILDFKQIFDGKDSNHGDLLAIEENKKELLTEEFVSLFPTIKNKDKDKGKELNFAVSRLFYMISAAFYLPEANGLAGHQSIRGLQALRDQQEVGLTKLNDYRTRFSGIILDESDIVLKNSAKSITNWLLFNIARRSGLIIASSATPWPNNIDEFLDHVRFLVPDLIDQYFDLPARFSNAWKQLENIFDQKDKNDAINSQAIAKFISSANYALQCLGDWKELVLSRLLCYVSSEDSATNNSSKFLFETDCNEHIFNFLTKKNQSDDKEFPPVSKFYAKCLSIKNNAEGENALAIPSGSNMLQEIFKLLGGNPGQVLKSNKVACYVDRYEIADFLASQFLQLCQEQDVNIFVSYFFAENGPLSKEDKALDRQAQLNAFNNILTFEDIESHILNLLKKHGLDKFYKRLDKLLEDVISRTAKKIQGSEKLNQGGAGRTKKKRKTTPKMSKNKRVRLFLKYAKNELPELCNGVAPELVDFFVALNSLATQSQNQIVMSYEELIQGLWSKVQSFMEVDSLSNLLLCVEEGGETFVKQLAVPQEQTQEQILFIDLIRLTFCYLDRFARSNLLIFGPAGASGIRIDADKLFILSGAWTLGRLSQIEGRVGRDKPDPQSSKRCEIYLPMTNTIFEFYILQCYVKKAMLNDFLMSKRDLFNNLIEPLLIVNQLKAVYEKRKQAKDTFFLTEAHRIVSRDKAPIGQRYVDMQPLEKSKKILEIVAPNLGKERQEIISKFYSIPASTLKMPHQQRFQAAQPIPIELPPAKLPMEDINLISPDRSSHQDIKHPDLVRPIMRELSNIFLTPNELAELNRFIQDSSQFIILCVPTRGYGDDLPMDKYVEFISLSTEKRSIGVIIVFGVNRSEGDTPITMNDFEEKQTQAFRNAHVFVKPFHFAWRNSDRKSPTELPPLGQMRNFCLEKAKFLFEFINRYKQTPSDIFFMSMDGDTQLTKQAFDYVFKKVKQPNRNVMVTGGYELFVQDASLPSEEGNNYSWLNYLGPMAQKFSRLSLNVYARCSTNVEKYKHYYGYFAEPLIMLSAPLSKTLLQVLLPYTEYKSDRAAPYGFWDMEGRRLRRFLLKLTRYNVDIYGPSENYVQRPLLMNTKKFSKRIKPMQPKAVIMPLFQQAPKLILDKQSLSTVIQRMCAQSQHCINPYFMGSNIASFIGKPPGIIRKFASYFYLRAFVELLMLGPKRSDNLLNMIYAHVKDNKDFSEQNLMNFGPKEHHQAIKNFIVKYFVDGLVNLPGAEKIENMKDVLVLVVNWARHMAKQLRDFFPDYFVEELTPNNKFKWMCLPENYPLSATKITETDASDTSYDDEDEPPKKAPRLPDTRASSDVRFFPVSKNDSVQPKEPLARNPALELFVGDGTAKLPSHLSFSTWYHPDICHYLLQLVENQAQCLRVIFDDAGYGNNTQTFKNQLQTLISLADLLKKPALFISKEPGANNHFICGLVKENNLVLINPLGITEQEEVYQTLAELKKEQTIKNVWLSSTRMQQREYEHSLGDTLVSCGPISVEVALHILKNFTLAELNDFWSSLKTNNEVILREKTQLNYFGISIQNTLLPENLQKLVSATDKKTYQSQVEMIRQRHRNLLETLPAYYAQQSQMTVEAYLTECKTASPAQVVYNALLTQVSTVDNIHTLPEYSLLAKALSTPQNPIMGKQPQKDIRDIFTAVSKGIVEQYRATKMKVGIECQCNKLFYIRKSHLNILLLSQELDIEIDAWKPVIQQEISFAHEADMWITVTIQLKDGNYFMCCYNQRCDEIGSKAIATAQESLDYLEEVIAHCVPNKAPEQMPPSHSDGQAEFHTRKRSISNIAAENEDSRQAQPDAKKAKRNKPLNSSSVSGKRGRPAKSKLPEQSNKLDKYLSAPQTSPDKSEPTTNPSQKANAAKTVTVSPTSTLPKLSDMPLTMFGSSTTSTQVNDDPAVSYRQNEGLGQSQHNLQN